MVSVRRHARHWRTYLAGGGLGLALFLAGFVVARAQYYEPAEQAAANEAAHSSRKQKAAEPLWERTEDDPVALYTLFLTIFTAALVGVSAVQIRYLVKADETARKAADNASDQARIAEAAFKASNRPWLIIEPIRPAAGTPWHVFTYQIVNHGNSPAFVHERFDLILTPKQRVTSEMIDGHPLARVPGIVVPPGGRSDLIMADIDGETNKNDGEGRTFAIGRIIYEGVNNLPCQTRFCWEHDSKEERYYEVQHPYGLNQRT